MKVPHTIHPLIVGAGLLFALHLTAAPAAAQVGNQTCGDGTTFTVQLPPAGSTVGHDSITLPNGCRIYALFVSGYERNRNFDELTFYRLAKFILENDGYVHYAWWNNLLKEYMARPLHADTYTVPILGTVLESNPGGLLGVHAAGFVPPTVLDLVPKAVPEEDDQFQLDAKRMLTAIRANNPNAIIVVAGHSMGGDAVARLGANTTVDIDLLAPIDPVGNRSTPVGNLTDRTFNWTRWRAAQESFSGFRRMDCIRNGLFCRDFDSRLFYVQYRCAPIGPYFDRPPIPATLAPGICAGPYVHPGTKRTFRLNIKRLYHRWQKEAVFPFDFLADERFGHWSPPLQAGDSLASFFHDQRPVLRNAVGEGNRDKTCAIGFDPRDPRRLCNPGDGHGEIVGFRSPTPGQPNPGNLLDNLPVAPLALRALNWPDVGDAAGRRQRLLDMVGADESWPHRPIDPDLCMVSAEMVDILSAILDANPTETTVDEDAPRTTAAFDPSANEHGWNNEDVAVSLSALDNSGGSGVSEVEYALTGAHVASEAVPGDTAVVALASEGETAVAYFARDEAGNVEAPSTAIVRIDKTPPEVGALTDVLPNDAGWSASDVVVSFSATDALSGVDTMSEPVVVTTEGAGQEITGGAFDRAGNESTATAIVSIDKTAPAIALAAPADGARYLLREGVAADYACVDGLSGLIACAGPVASGAVVDTASVGNKTFTVGAEDVAGNGTSRSHGYHVGYAFGGFREAWVPLPGVNTAKPGERIPLRWRIDDALGDAISERSAIVGQSTAIVPCEAPDASPEAFKPTPGVLSRSKETGKLDAVHYTAESGEFEFIWRTASDWKGCRLFELTLDDGTSHRLLFQFQ